jgi:hypothetical protein
MSTASDRTTNGEAGATPATFGETIGGPTTSSWREQALTRIAELEDLALAFSDTEKTQDVLAQRIHRHVLTAREAAEGKAPQRRGMLARFRALLGGSPLERTASNMDAAEADLLRLAPREYVEGQIPGLLAHVRAHLPLDDPRRQQMELLCDGTRKGELTGPETNAIIAAVRAASSAARREVVQVRSFRNILLVTAVLLSVAAGGLVVLGVTRPDLVPMCFEPEGSVVCPIHVEALSGNPTTAQIDTAIGRAVDRWDIPLVALMGMMAAAISAAVAVRKLRGTTTPYALPVALAVLKLPTGALTAVLGLLLMRGGFVPGLSALDSPAQILAWALVFGYAQQLFTRLVDDRAHDVLNQVGGQEQPRPPVTTSLVVATSTNGAGEDGGTEAVATESTTTPAK